MEGTTHTSVHQCGVTSINTSYTLLPALDAVIFPN